MLWDLTFLNKFAFCGGETQKGSDCHFFPLTPYFKQPFGAQHVITCFSAAFWLPFTCLPCEAALSHPLWHPRRLLLRLPASDCCVHSWAAHSASLSLRVSQPPKKSLSFPRWVQQGTKGKRLQGLWIKLMVAPGNDGFCSCRLLSYLAINPWDLGKGTPVLLLGLCRSELPS